MILLLSARHNHGLRAGKRSLAGKPTNRCPPTGQTHRCDFRVGLVRSWKKHHRAIPDREKGTFVLRRSRRLLLVLTGGRGRRQRRGAGLKALARSDHHSHRHSRPSEAFQILPEESGPVYLLNHLLFGFACVQHFLDVGTGEIGRKSGKRKNQDHLHSLLAGEGSSLGTVPQVAACLATSAPPRVSAEELGQALYALDPNQGTEPPTPDQPEAA